MFELIITILVLWTGWRAYRSARAAGTWSNKKFALVMLLTLALCAVVSLPLLLISPETLQQHAVFATVTLVIAIGIGVTVLAIYAKRWKTPS